MNPEVICPNCGKPAPWVENKEKYGRNYGKSFMCYYCKECDYYVGCHNNTRQPLGTMISGEHCKWRKAVHNKIDPLWQSGKINRGYLYSRLSLILGYTYHTGEADMETCKKVMEIDDKLLTCSKLEFDLLKNKPMVKKEDLVTLAVSFGWEDLGLQKSGHLTSFSRNGFRANFYGSTGTLTIQDQSKVYDQGVSYKKLTLEKAREVLK